MLDRNSKYSRWAWGAVIGLVVVILIAGFLVAITLNRNPDPNNEIAEVEDGSGVVVGDTESDSGTRLKTEESEKDSGILPGGNEAESNNSGSNTGSSSDFVENQVTQNDAENLPQSGPESVISTFALIAIVGSLIAYNVQMVAKR